MRTPVSKALLFGGMATLCGSVAPAGAQQLHASDGAARAVSTVMDFRRSYLDDPLAFDACTVERALGPSVDAGVASRLVFHVRDMLDDVETPCPRRFEQGRSVVLLDSVRLSDSTAHVHLTVLRGELIHREAYALDAGSNAVYMGIQEVRVWGPSQAYPQRPRPRASTSGPQSVGGERRPRNPGNWRRAGAILRLLMNRSTGMLCPLDMREAPTQRPCLPD